MSLRDQPYLPLYVQDFLTDEKLMLCSASATGVYIRILCILHKSENYGRLKIIKGFTDFAEMLSRFMPWDAGTIRAGLDELITFDVLQKKGDFLVQKRMENDGKLSIIRANAGSIGGRLSRRNKTSYEIKQNQSKTESKNKANTENEIEYENENEDEDVKKRLKESEIENYETLFQYWEQNKKGGKYKNEASRARMLKKLVTLSGNDLSFAREAIFHALDSNYQGFCNGNELYYKRPPENGKNNEYGSMIERELCKIATDDQILRVMERVPRGRWFLIDNFLRKRYPGSRGIAHLEAKIDRDQEALRSVTCGIGG